MADILSGIVDLEHGSAHSLYRQLYEQLRTAILGGQLPAGTRLPSSRAMAAQLDVARNTVLTALDQLSAEGYLEARQGAGTIVTAQLSGELTNSVRQRDAAPVMLPKLSRAGQNLAGVARVAAGGEAPRAFLPGIPDLQAFPHAVWGRLLRRASQSLDPEAQAYGHVSGLPELRSVLCDHLREARGVRAHPDQIIITSSAQAALDLIARALVDPGDRVWIEEPGYPGARAAFLGAGGELVPVPLDQGGLDPDGAGRGTAPSVIYLTPSHQYPTGRLMPLARRLELLDVAERKGAILIEDDYDSEFQFQGRPVAALQGLDTSGRVIYAGTFSKILQPGIRVGYLVVQEGLAEPLARMQRNTGQAASAVVQRALADFISEGHLRAHIRRMCALYQERQTLLRELLETHCGDRLSVEMPAGGMQFIGEFGADIDDRRIAAALASRGVQARPLSSFYLGDADKRGLLLGFAGYEREAMVAGVRALAEALDAALRGR